MWETETYNSDFTDCEAQEEVADTSVMPPRVYVVYILISIYDWIMLLLAYMGGDKIKSGAQGWVSAYYCVQIFLFIHLSMLYCDPIFVNYWRKSLAAVGISILAFVLSTVILSA